MSLPGDDITKYTFEYIFNVSEWLRRTAVENFTAWSRST